MVFIDYHVKVVLGNFDAKSCYNLASGYCNSGSMLCFGLIVVACYVNDDVVVGGFLWSYGVFMVWFGLVGYAWFGLVGYNVLLLLSWDCSSVDTDWLVMGSYALCWDLWIAIAGILLFY